MRTSSKTIPSENADIFPVQDLRKIYEERRLFNRTGLTKKQKITQLYMENKFEPTCDSVCEWVFKSSNADRV